jgi:hypothetical protein
LTVIYEGERSPAYDALWRLLLSPLPKERAAETDKAEEVTPPTPTEEPRE